MRASRTEVAISSVMARSTGSADEHTHLDDTMSSDIISELFHRQVKWDSPNKKNAGQTTCLPEWSESLRKDVTHYVLYVRRIPEHCSRRVALLLNICPYKRHAPHDPAWKPAMSWMWEDPMNRKLVLWEESHFDLYWTWRLVPWLSNHSLISESFNQVNFIIIHLWTHFYHNMFIPLTFI